MLPAPYIWWTQLITVSDGLTQKLKRFLEERQKFVAVAVVDGDAKKMSFLYEWRARTCGADIQHVCDAILLLAKQTINNTCQLHWTEANFDDNFEFANFAIKVKWKTVSQLLLLLLLLLHPFNGPFSGTTQVSQYQKGFYWSKRHWVAVASAGPYASMHLAPDR